MSFYCFYSCFFLLAASEQSALTTAVSRLFFATVSLFSVLFRCEFQQGGVVAIVYVVSGVERERERFVHIHMVNREVECIFDIVLVKKTK